MTKETGKPNAPTDALKAPQVREIKDMGAERPNARWPARFLAVVGMGTLAACGGEAANEPVLPDNPLPAGVCTNIAGRVTDVGVTEVGLDEAILGETAPNAVKLGNDTYRLQVLEINLDGADSDVKVIITDSAGNPVAFLEDQDGNRMANVDYLEAGDSWTFRLPDGSEVTVTVCAIFEDLEGNEHVVLQSNGFDWCTSIDRTVGNAEDYETVTYGTQDISRILHETGETRDRDDAQCMELVREIVEETTTLETPMEPGTQPADSTVKLLGRVKSVITLSNSGYVLLGDSVLKDEKGVAETLVGEGISILVNEVSLYGAEYEADISVTVDGVTMEVIEGAKAGDVFKFTNLEGKDMYVRVNSVSSDGMVEIEVIENPIKLQDGGTYTDPNGNVWRVEHTKVGDSVSGWRLVKEE